METVNHTLRGVLPHPKTGVDFVRLEMLKKESSPIALVWYKTSHETKEKGARIDLDKQVFLDDFGTVDRGAFANEARLIVRFLHGLSSKTHTKMKKSKASKKKTVLTAGSSFTA